jgi:hypothetical protein
VGGDAGRGRGRGHEQGEHQQRAGDLAGAGGRDREQQQKPDAQGVHRHPARGGDRRVNAGEDQRPTQDGQRRQAPGAGAEQDQHLAIGNAGDGAEQQVVQPA